MTRCLDRWGRKGRWKKFSRRNLGISRRKKIHFKKMEKICHKNLRP